LSGFDNTI